MDRGYLSDSTSYAIITSAHYYVSYCTPTIPGEGSLFWVPSPGSLTLGGVSLPFGGLGSGGVL